MRSTLHPLALLVAFLFPAVAAAQIVVNEIMYVPNAPEPEWVELYNTADTAVTMVGWTVQDRTTAKPTIPAGTIPAKGYLLLTRDTAALKSARSVSSLLLQVNVPSLNNTGDDIILRNAAGKTIDSVSWSSSWGGTGGISLERIADDLPSNDRDSWRSAVDSTGATPGFRNSVAPAARDLTIRSLAFDPDTKEVRIVIANVGTERSVGGTVSLYYDKNNDTLGTPEETQSGRSIPQIVRGDSLSLSLPWNRPLTVPGESGLVVVDHPGDEHPEDNRKIVLIREKFVDTGIVINEFIYAPAAPEPEWVELVNRGIFPVDLTGWVLHDAGTGRPKIGSVILLPGAYLVLTKDTAELRDAREVFSTLIQFALPSLNNGSDNIVLRNRSGVVVDSISYISSWGGSNGRSVERRQPGLKSNDSSSWGSSIDPTRGTAGKQNSLVPPNYNLALRSASFHPDGNEVRIIVANTGLERTEGGTILLHVDANANAIPEPTEEIARVDLASIKPSDSTSTTLLWNRPLRLEGETAILLLQLEGDERSGDDTLRLVLRQPTVDTGLIVNEIMYDPNDPEPEWLEIVNRGSLPVDLAGWRIGDASGSSGPLPSAILLPGEFIVVTPDTTALTASRSVSSRRIRILLPAFNNSGDGVVLRNPSGIAIDSLRYVSSWGGKNGISLERKGFDLSSTDPNSWTSSVDPTGATPGSTNSWKPILHDVAVGALLFDADSLTVSGSIYNHGLEEATATEAILYFDADGNGLPASVEQIGRKSIGAIPAGDSTTFTLAWPRPLTAQGERGLIEIALPGDQHLEDNIGAFTAAIPPVDTGVVVNELMYDPNSPESEWVELYNRGTFPVALKGWTIQDGSTSVATLPGGTIAPGGYVIVTSDSAELRRARDVSVSIVQILLPAFNNSGDRVLVRNPSGKIIEQFTYTSAWGGEDGRSLERIDLNGSAEDGANWGTSVDQEGGTPGRVNSVAGPKRNIALRSITFDPATSGVTIVAANIGEEPTPASEGIIYFDKDETAVPDADNELARMTIPSIPLNDSITFAITWPRPLRVEGERGIVLLVMDRDSDPDDNIGTFRVGTPVAEEGIVINEIMYAPNSPEPEWVELVNTASLPVNLAGWSVSDGTTTRTLTKGIIEPGAFILLTADTATLRETRVINSAAIQLPLPSLNNSDDALILRNSSGRVVDSLHYNASWGGSGGRSLERRHPSKRAIDSTSWRSCEDSTGTTPGRVNSIIAPARNLAIDSITFDPLSGRITTQIRNSGIEEITSGELILYYDPNGNSSEESLEEIGRTDIPVLVSDEERSIAIAWPRTLKDEGEFALVRVGTTDDLIEEDNRKSILLRRAPLDSSLIITEIMFDPVPFGELAGGEYIELYNPNDRPIPLAGWKVADGSGKEKVIRDEGMFVYPGRFAVVAADSAIYLRFPLLADSTNVVVLNADLGLNNTEDDAILRNPNGRTIDSIRYNDTWHWDQLADTKGIALERLTFDGESSDRRNWASCTARDGGTPGSQNSRSVPPATANAELNIDPPIISPDDDGFEDFTRISWKLPTNAARVVVSIYDRVGRRIARPVNNDITSSEGNIIWDGLDDDGRPLPIGIYIIRIEAYDADAKGTKFAQSVITVARRL